MYSIYADAAPDSFMCMIIHRPPTASPGPEDARPPARTHARSVPARSVRHPHPACLPRGAHPTRLVPYARPHAVLALRPRPSAPTLHCRAAPRHATRCPASFLSAPFGPSPRSLGPHRAPRAALFPPAHPLFPPCLPRLARSAHARISTAIPRVMHQSPQALRGCSARAPVRAAAHFHAHRTS